MRDLGNRRRFGSRRAWQTEGNPNLLPSNASVQRVGIVPTYVRPFFFSKSSFSSKTNRSPYRCRTSTRMTSTTIMYFPNRSTLTSKLGPLAPTRSQGSSSTIMSPAIDAADFVAVDLLMMMRVEAQRPGKAGEGGTLTRGGVRQPGHECTVNEERQR